ncbi:MAG: F0F1 ATP synthase subunit A [Phycisphaeraceae bacterium]|nr:F0F1 ATP synthase subunit A [Phycisphaeraceae bacterium]
MFILASSNPLEHVLPHPVFHIGGFAVTNHLIMSTFAALLVLVTFMWVASRVKVRGTGTDSYLTKGNLAHMFETMCVFIREQVARPNLKHLTDKYIYYLWTVFFFILFCNLLGMIPFGYIASLIISAAGGNGNDWSMLGGTATSNLSLNVPLALTAFTAIVFIGIRESGVAYFKHFAPGPAYMWPLIIPLEVMSLFIKCTVLAVRLFGTMLAGHLVLAALVGMIFIFANLSPVLGYGVGIGVVLLNLVLSLLELFIAMLQAFIFTFLTTLFIAQGAVHDDHGHEHDHEHDPALAFDPAEVRSPA